MKSKVGLLSERLSKYLDRPIIDYWRKVQGVNVGFRGNPGQGVPIAGPPTLTGGAGTANPLLNPLLKRYKQGTFIGDAIRKKNFPLSAINFIEQVVGASEKEIREGLSRVEAEIGPSAEDRMKELVTDALGKPGSKKFDQFVASFGDAMKRASDAVDKAVDEASAEALAGFKENPLQLAAIRKAMLDRELGLYGPNYGKAANLTPIARFKDSRSLDSSDEEYVRKMATELYDYLKTGEGSGAFSGASKFRAPVYVNDPTSPPATWDFRSKTINLSDWELQIGTTRLAAFSGFMSQMNPESEGYRSGAIKGLSDADKGLLAVQLTVGEDKAKKMSARRWLAEQHKEAMSSFDDHFGNPKWSSSVMYDYLSSLGVAGTNGPEDEANSLSLSGINLTEDQVKSFFRDLYLVNQILMPEEDYTRVTRGMRQNLPGMGEAESKSFLEEIKSAGASVRISGQRAVSGFSEGDTSEFKGYSIVDLEVPKEAILSAYSGIRPQASDFDSERESLVIGAAEIAVPASNLKYVPK